MINARRQAWQQAIWAGCSQKRQASHQGAEANKRQTRPWDPPSSRRPKRSAACTASVLIDPDDRHSALAFNDAGWRIVRDEEPMSAQFVLPGLQWD